jgi:hypothetical protein
LDSIFTKKFVVPEESIVLPVFQDEYS